MIKFSRAALLAFCEIYETTLCRSIVLGFDSRRSMRSASFLGLARQETHATPRLYPMPHRSNPRPRRKPETVHYSESRLRQRYFPMRRKTKKTMPQSTPTSVERQRTMTQTGYVATLSSSKRKKGKHEEV